ncbi:hypothetical protein SLS60_005418 [Paraconiothyrium brasiliense]|uniref:Uncharacterized protein n=1 Tax=Paraconiothyrium brasiliense TaxID=300254 RepID=A0ABR3RHI6_9PLEO
MSLSQGPCLSTARASLNPGVTPNPTVSVPVACWWLQSSSVASLGPGLTPEATLLVPASSTLTTAKPPSSSAYIETPSETCEGFRVNEQCVPFQVWLDLYTKSFPASIAAPGVSHTQPHPGYKAPGVVIDGPLDGCNGFTVNGFCWEMSDFLAKVGDRGGWNSNVTAITATATAASYGNRSRIQKLGFIGLPLAIVIFAAIGGYFVWRRGEKKKKEKAEKTGDTTHSPPPAQSTTNSLAPQIPMHSIAELYGKPAFDAERGEPALMEHEDLKKEGNLTGQTYKEVDEQRQKRGGRYMRNGVKNFDEGHERRSRGRERMARNGAGGGQNRELTEEERDRILFEPVR